MVRTFSAVVFAAVLATPVLAQSPAPAQAPSAGEGLGGPVVAGVCLLSREAVFANAKIGVAATARLQQLATEAQAEVDAEQRPIEADLATFRTEAPRLTPEQRQAREQALAARLAPVQAKAQQRAREIDATRAKALERISTEAQPAIAQVYGQRNCGLLLDRNSALGGNFTNDLTAAVVQALDARISTITFNRETLPANPPTR
ncbi:MAG: OmpH family outer membrane protein [Pseudomonadota bacterium]|nr:OmpH family outer membrane protein [Pseudomonadota bacterium]